MKVFIAIGVTACLLFALAVVGKNYEQATIRSLNDAGDSK